MNLSELQGKEVINMHDGVRLGMINQSELVFDEITGDLESIVIPNGENFFNVFGQEEYLIIPWEAIVKIGSEVVIVNLKSKNYKAYSS
ncbi:YlmC/YmxH family sporulation protein [Natroniella sp. ANB-PHB2]|uniref:YlmC/YmxH family sporulation protein n=1 Tax=Natroniella sp. ANB-PHB2 TaxID=3384444 RepID=UPI0038D3B2F3